MSSLPQTQRALVHTSNRTLALHSDIHIPRLRPTSLLIKTSHVALNPVDWKLLRSSPSPGAIAGCDYSGTVIAFGSAVTKHFSPGERVAGFVHGGDSEDPETGAFAEYVVAKGDVQMKVEGGVSDAQAATLGVGITTVGQALYQSLGVPMPPGRVDGEREILIYGGSTATGSLAVQFARLSGLRVHTTASSSNHVHLLSLGAHKCYPYTDPHIGRDIRAATHNTLALAFDTISEHHSPQICADALTSDPALHPHYTSLLPVRRFPRKDVRNSCTAAFSALEEGSPEWDFAVRFWGIAEELINKGKIKPHTVELREGGLEAIPQGLRDLEEGKVHARKLVYKV